MYHAVYIILALGLAIGYLRLGSNLCRKQRGENNLKPIAAKQKVFTIASDG